MVQLLLLTKILSHSPVEDVRQERQTIDSCFNYVLGLIDGVLKEGDLAVERDVANYGQIDQQIAKAIKAEVLLTRASPSSMAIVNTIAI